MSRVALFYCHKIYASGVTTYTAHLYRALQVCGHGPTIYMVQKRDSNENPNRFADYKGIGCVGVGAATALHYAAHMPSLIVAPCHPSSLPDAKLMHKLQQKGARAVLHDPTQLKNFPAPFVQPPILVRRAMLRLYRKGVYIPHPYEPQGQKARGTKHAVCTARIATSKRPRLILQANRLLPKKLRVDMKGAAQNRMLSYGLEKTYGDVYKQPKNEIAYRQSFEAPVDLCSKYRYHVDMTKFDGDGGGTQYAQLEAIDAGCVPIMHQDWNHPGAVFEMGHHYIGVDGPEMLARVLKECHEYSYYHDTDAMIQVAGKILLKKHDPHTIGAQYAKELDL